MKIRDRITEFCRVRASELVPHPKNWRTHPGAQGRALRALLLDIGYADALIARRLSDGRLQIIDGHLRAEITPDVMVPVLVLDVTEDEAEKILLTHDPLTAMAGADAERLKALLESVRPTDESVREMLKQTAGSRIWEMVFPDDITEVDVAPERSVELQKKWAAEDGQLWQIHRHRIICGDCTDPATTARLWGGDATRARLIWTDPPYGVSYADKNRLLNRSDRGNRIQKPIVNDDLSAEKIETLFAAALASALPYCATAASIYATVPSGPLIANFIRGLNGGGFAFKHILIWVKNHFVIGMADYHSRHEPIVYGWIENGAHYFAPDRSQDSVFEVDKPQVSDLHSTSKPVELVARMIANSSRAGELVYDPFGGGGTTVVAAHQLGRTGYAVEIDPGYVAVSLERLSLLGLKPELVK